MQLTPLGNRLFAPLKLDQAARILGGMQAAAVAATFTECYTFIVDPPYYLMDKDYPDQ